MRMDQSVKNRGRAAPFTGPQVRWRKAFLVLFVVFGALAWVRLCAPGISLGGPGWSDGLLLITTVILTLTWLSGQLPAQNALLAAALLGGAGAAAHALSAAVGIPFGPLVDHPSNIGPMIFPGLPCAVPLIWVVAVLNARGVARLILAGKRGTAQYGVWILGMTVLLVVVFELGWQPYAALYKRYWSWAPTRIPSNWYGTPWSDFAGCAVTTTLTLLFVTPALINKSPLPPKQSFDPLVVWELLSLLFLTGTAVRHQWGVVALGAIQMICVAICAVAGVMNENRIAPPGISRLCRPEPGTPALQPVDPNWRN